MSDLEFSLTEQTKTTTWCVRPTNDHNPSYLLGKQQSDLQTVSMLAKQRANIQLIMLYHVLSLWALNLLFSHLGFWSGNFILIAPFPDHCLLVPFLYSVDALCCTIFFSVTDSLITRSCTLIIHLIYACRRRNILLKLLAFS